MIEEARDMALCVTVVEGDVIETPDMDLGDELPRAAQVLAFAEAQRLGKAVYALIRGISEERELKYAMCVAVPRGPAVYYYEAMARDDNFGVVVRDLLARVRRVHKA